MASNEARETPDVLLQLPERSRQLWSDEIPATRRRLREFHVRRTEPRNRARYGLVIFLRVFRRAPDERLHQQLHPLRYFNQRHTRLLLRQYYIRSLYVSPIPRSDHIQRRRRRRRSVLSFSVVHKNRPQCSRPKRKNLLITAFLSLFLSLLLKSEVCVRSSNTALA